MKTSEEQPIRGIMLGPAIESRGGISAVERMIVAHCQQPVHLRHVPTVCDGSKWHKLGTFLLALPRFVFLLLAWRPHLVHAHFSSRASTWRKLLLAAIARSLGKPCILHAHGSEFRDFFSSQPPWRQRLIASGLRRSTCLITLSQSWKQYYQRISGLPDEQVIVLPNPVRLPSRVPDRRNRRGVTLLFLGRMGERKGPLRIVEAFRMLSPEASEKTHVVLAGDGEVERVRQEVCRLGLQQHISVMDWVDTRQRETLLADADIYVLPSLNEGLPMSILEAMSWGLPVISSPVGGIPEFVQDGFNGLLVPPTDIPALAQAMQRLIEDEELRLQMGANARASVEHLDIQNYWKQLLEVYRSVLAVRAG
ncbi:MAG: glycosyltransferase family 4 protein [Armatimonadota bacterium]|nr:glycosyltransferase family 4 protein [Armatimonadota bacterium]